MNLLFDLDGTLADPLKAFEGSLAHAYQNFGLTPLSQEVIRGLIGPPLHTQLPELLGPEKAHLASEVMRVYREHHGVTGIYQYVPYAGMKEAVRRLRARHLLLVATSKPRVYAEQIFRHFGEVNLFHQIYGSEFSGANSRKGELIAHIIRERRLDPQETLMIGDRKHDIAGAQENGIRSIGVTWGYGSEAELRSAGATRICSTWTQLADTIESLDH